MIDSQLFKKEHLLFDNSSVNIIVFGPGYGESIVIYLPDLGWGIIDSCLINFKKRKYNPALEYLKQLNVDRLAFLILTHPHLDHYKGIEHILFHYSGAIDRIGYYSGEGLKEYASYLARKKILNEPGLKTFSDIFLLIEKAKKSGANIIKLSERKEVIRKGLYKNNTIEMISLSPSEDSEKKYIERLYKFIPKVKGASIKDLKDSEQNIISSAIWCEINNVRFIFGSDLENGTNFSGWSGVLNNLDSPNLSATFVKIPHHGSPNAFNENIWKIFSNDSKVPVSVTTPYIKSRALRPDPVILKKISNYTKNIYVTSKFNFKSPQKIYNNVDLESGYGVIDWKYIKMPNQIGFVKTTIPLNNESEIKVVTKNPAYKY